MKLVEALIGFFVLIVVLVAGFNFLYLSSMKYDQYLNQLNKNAIKMSIYNYADSFISQVNDAGTGYISMVNGKFKIGVGQGDMYYECNLSGGNLIMSNKAYTGIFCTINVYDEKIYKYKLMP